MSIATEITALNNNLTAAKNAVTAKGGTVGDTGLAGLASEIATIPSGGALDNYGTVTYLDNGVEKTVTMANEDDYLELTIGQSSAQIEINGVTMIKGDITGVVIADGVQYIPNNFCNGCSNLTSATIPSSVHIIGFSVFNGCNITTASFDLQNVHQIGDYFLQNNYNFNSPISLPKVREIGAGFLQNTGLNSSLVINDSCETIGGSFLRACVAFAQPFSVPSGLLMSSGLIGTPGARFMQDCKNFVGPLVCNCPTTNFATGTSERNNMLATSDVTAPMYTTGVTLTGTYANDWKTALPDRDSSPYRKLIVGS